jgi:hypothetical protein
LGDESFDVYVDEVYIGGHSDLGVSGETWCTRTWVYSGVGDKTVNVTLVATGADSLDRGTLGRLAVDWVSVMASDLDDDTVFLEDVYPGVTSPSGDYRWLDVADYEFYSAYRSSYDYSDVEVSATLIYDTDDPSFNGVLQVCNLKPNFGYQVKLAGDPLHASNELIGYTGRWWQETWGDESWGSGQNLNVKGDGSFPNPNDEVYQSRKGILNPSSPTGLHYKYTGYLVFDYFTTDSNGNYLLEFDQDSSFHVLWRTSHHGPDDDDGPVKSVTFDPPDPHHPAYYGLDYSEATVGLFGEWERLPMGGVYLYDGVYCCSFYLTEESFHGSGGTFSGNWAAAMGKEVAFTLYGGPEFVIPEYPAGTLLPLVATLVALGLYVVFRKR